MAPQPKQPDVNDIEITHTGDLPEPWIDTMPVPIQLVVWVFALTVLAVVVVRDQRRWRKQRTER